MVPRSGKHVESSKSGGVQVDISKYLVEERVEEKESVSVKEEEIKEDVPTPPEKKVVEEVEEENPCVSPHQYKPMIPFPQWIMKAKVEA